MEENAEMRVTKRNGNIEDIEFDKILNRVKKLGQEANIHINYSALTMKVIDQLYDKIPTTKIDELTAQQCASLSTQHPDYGVLAGRILVSNHQKNTDPSFYNVMEKLYHFKDPKGKHSPLLSKETWDHIKENRDVLEGMIDEERDYLIDYFGFKTLERAYLFRINNIIVERPQHLWLRVSVGIHGDNIEKVKETYDLMSQKYFIHATPTLFNAGTPRPQLSSCYLIAMEEDSLEGIFDTLKDCAKISKWAGGIGLHIHNIRANNSLIRGTNGKSSGLVPMLKVFNDTARFINQGGKRNGSFAIYLEPWHPDIEDFLEMRKNHGDEEMRARDLFYALWTPDLFMERVKENGKWSYFCPDECPGLADVYGDAFKTLYEKYEAEGRERKRVNARDLWFKILDAQMETGTPYLLFKDAANEKSNQKNLGTIKSSNLCVAPETKILTDKGHVEIGQLEGQQVNIWNGEEFSEVTIHKTGENQELMEVETSDGCILSCTPYHKFYIQNKYSSSKGNLNKHIELIEAQHLKEGDKIIKCEFPVIDNDGKEDIKYSYTHGFFCGDGTYHNNYLQNEKECNFKALVNHSYCKRHIAYEDNDDKLERQTTETNYKCKGVSYTKKPTVSLYGEKKELLPFLNYRSVGNEDATGRLNVCLPVDINEKFYVPINDSLKNKMEWLSGYCDADGCITRNGDNQQLQISSIEKDFLMNVKLMLQTCGVNPKIRQMHNGKMKFMPDSNRNLKEYECQPLYRLLITSYDLQKMVENGFSPKRLKITNSMPNRNAQQFVQITATRRRGRIDDTFCFNEPKKHTGIFNGIITSQCTEILEYSDDKETAVCNLASVSLPAFVVEKERETVFDYDKLHEVVKVMTSNLNRVIDINYYPTPKTQRSNFLHRPIGIGVQGLADIFMMMDIPFHSDEAKEINKQIFETMYHAALERSNEIAKERSEKILDKIKTTDKFMEFIQMWENFQTIYNDSGDEHKHEKMVTQPDHELYTLDLTYAEMMNMKKGIKSNCGSYSSFEGSPASQGILQYDFWNTTPSPKYDWQKLKDSIQKYGLRNSLLLAPMPTASTSQILGNNECFEPLTSNIYSRSTLAGEFVVANKYLMRDLIKLGLWNDKIKNNIVANKGSIQQLTILPEEIRNKYKIVWEIPMKHLIDMSADRGAFICQSQSLNLWQEDPTYNTLTSMHFYSWKKGLKTGIYYLRRKGKHQAQQFTVEPDKKEEKEKEENEICEMCSA
jgi:ribonucleoside-diphosphate reductase alpha chain